MDGAPFFEYSSYLKARYGRAPRRVAVDAGFGCPHREGSGGGCLFCAADGNRAPKQPDSYGRGARGYALDVERMIAAVEAQVRAAAERSGDGAGRGERSILFFQAYTNTYGPPELLRKVYDGGLAAGNFAELAVATRPDCVDGPIADLLASYLGRVEDVWVELGLQSSNPETLRRVDRGHGPREFERACALLGSRGLKVAAHLILGLPGEGRADFRASAEFVGACGALGVKFHDLQVPRTSRFFRRALEGEVILLSRRAYLEALADAIEALPPSVAIMRLAAEIPDGERAMPRELFEKAALKRDLIALMGARGSRQGSSRGVAPGR